LQVERGEGERNFKNLDLVAPVKTTNPCAAVDKCAMNFHARVGNEDPNTQPTAVRGGTEYLKGSHRMGSVRN
jgi:hypothetical protein